MTNRIIFLDYDGVLNDTTYLADFHSKPGEHSGKDSLDPKRITLLKHLCSLTNAKVVLTSAWRNDMQTRKHLIQKWGIPIIGSTPHQKDQRGEEINQWIKDKKFTGQYIIIDDECSDLTDIQKDHLILTREPGTLYPTLGLRKKHLQWAVTMFTDTKFPTIPNESFIRCILEAIEQDWLRVMWNIHQKEFNDENPWQNTGNVKGYKNDTFEVHAYDWGWDYSDSNTPQPPNFKWRDLEITWYKWCGRGLSTNRQTSHNELALMLNECLESLNEEDKLYD